ncbi:MAG TPA: AraC family transcriptional regulator [Chryseolinea sp.]|nr:AraC family transcriptional regulator [Chryseolinea sp.]
MPVDHLPKVYLYRRIVLAKLFIDQHFSESIDLSAIASEAYFSKFHFIRLFKSAYDKTPHQYLTWVRIEHAKLLLQAKISITDTCFSVGFEEISSFTHLFKRVTKLTPSVYQRQQLHRQSEISKDPLKFIPGCFAEKKGWKKVATFNNPDNQGK